VNDPVLVGVVQRVGDLVQQRDGFVELETLPLLEDRVETLALEQLMEYHSSSPPAETR